MRLSRAVTCVSGIVFPFYIYPSQNTSCDQWQPMISALNAHPTLPFTLIINPESGPGGSELPDAEYQTCLPTLRQTSNQALKLVGYVLTNYTNRAVDDVEADVDTYANWPASYRPDGIFFDEVTADAATASAYNSYVSYAKSLTWSSATGYTILNPGTTVPDAYFMGGADLIVTDEVYFSDFENSQLVLDDASEPPSHQSVILHDAPSTLPTSTITQLISSDQLNSIFITDVEEVDNAYGSYPSYWIAFVDAVGSAAGGC